MMKTTTIKTLKLLLSGLIILTFVFGHAQEFYASNTNSHTQINTYEISDLSLTSLLSEKRERKENVVKEVFLVRLVDAGDREILVMDVIMDLTGVMFEDARNIVANKGIVGENLTMKQALNFKERLEEVGATSRIEEMKSKPSLSVNSPIKNGTTSETFSVKLVDAGGREILVMDVIMDLTGVMFEDARNIVANKGIVGENLTMKQALNFKERLEEVGATSRIEEMKSKQNQRNDNIDVKSTKQKRSTKR